MRSATANTLRHSVLRAVAVVVVLMSWASRLLAAPFAPQDADWEGCSIFASMIAGAVGSQRFVATDRLDWDALQPEDGVIILHPTRASSTEDLSSFLRAGGRVAILDDYGAGDEVLSRFHIRRIPAPQRPARSLRNNAALAIAEPVADVSGHNMSVHPTVASVTQLVTNHPTGFQHPNLSPVLQIRARGEPDVVIAVAGQVGKGRLLAVSDPSIVINQMMRYPGNREFALGLAKYLVDDDSWGTRGGKLYLVVNGFEELGSYGNESGIGRAVSSVARDVSAMLRETRAQGLPGPLSVVLGALAALSTVAWLGLVAARACRRSPPRYARPVPLVAQGGVAGRAAVLAAPTTHRALAVLELKSALEEAMAARLGLELPVSPSALFEAAASIGGLDDSRLKALKRLVLRMGIVETSVTAGRPIRIREKDLKAAADLVHDLIDTVERNGNHASFAKDRS